MTFRASYFTVLPQTYRRWDPAQPNYLVTVLQPVAAAPFASVPESRPAVLARPFDIQFRNVALLNFAQLQVKPVGSILDETVPLAWRPRDFLAPNLLTIQPPAAAPRVNQLFDRPQPVTRQPDFLAPNLLTTTLGTIFSPGVASWASWPQPPKNPPELQPRNLALTPPVVAAKPFSTQIFSDRLQAARQPEFVSRNLVIALRPLAGPIFERPAVQPRPLDLLPRNLLTIQPITAAAPFAIRSFERPAPLARAQDFIVPNIALAPTVFVFRAPLISWPAPVVHPIDVPIPNLVINAPVAQAPRFFVIFEKPQPAWRSQDFPLPNIPALAARQARVKPVGAQLQEAKPVTAALRVDAPIPNLLTSTLSVAVINPAVQRLDEVVPNRPIRQLDFQFPNLVLTPTQFVFRAPLISRPVATRLVIDGPIPNLLTTTLGVTFSPSTAIWAASPQPPKNPPELQPPNLLTTTLATAAAKPFSNLLFERRSAPSVPRDPASPNLLVTILSTVAGTPFVAPSFLLADRPAPTSPTRDHPPVNFLVFRPTPVVSPELHQNPFFITMGRLSQLGNLPS